MPNRIDFLVTVPLFAGLPKQTLERLDTGLVERHYPAGADIVTEDKGGITLQGPSRRAMHACMRG